MTKIYDVTISAVTKTTPSDGFIDPFNIDYYRSKVGAPAGTSIAVMTTRKRAFERWRKIQSHLQGLGNLYISQKTAPGADVNTAPTSVSFRILVEHGGASIQINDENVVGAKLTGVAAIKRVIARAMMVGWTANQEVWDPTTVSGFPNVVSFGHRTLSVQTGALCATIAEAEAVITVVAVD